ncbi:DNA segregation ATPase FtsK/SpoIIIE-like protein, partial [Bacillus iocasae]
TEPASSVQESAPIQQVEEVKEEKIYNEKESAPALLFENASSVDVEQQEEKQEEKQEERSNPSRRYVPYNVMMLKKDRRKMEQKQIEKKPELTQPQQGNYRFPSMNLLNIPPAKMEDDNQWLEDQRELLDITLKNFNVRAKVVNVTQGPTVTRFEVQPEPGVKVNKITNLTDDIKLSLAARDIRIEAPIPGKNTIGIEVPNRHSKPVLLREILRSPAFNQSQSPLTVALGLDISGDPVVTDLNKMPHGLIAGATGSGKSVCINTVIVSLLYKAAPHEVKLMLIDPKMVELAPYNGIPHLVSPVITDAKAATAALKWAVEEMERRYELFAHTGVRDITKYNERVRAHNEKSGELPYLVIIIDELADLMMVSPGEVEEAICRIAQKARACGIHLLLATQRPSVDVITGLIKANVPTRVAFSVSSQVDSRTIIDTGGAEKLLGRGDMLLLENGSSKTVRVQGNFVSDEEIDNVVAHVKSQQKPTYLFSQEELLTKNQTSLSQEEDELFYEACEYVLEQGGASTSSLQRRFRIGYNRAARLIDMMEEQGIISEARGSKPRDVLITEGDLQEIHSS